MNFPIALTKAGLSLIRVVDALVVNIKHLNLNFTKCNSSSEQFASLLSLSFSFCSIFSLFQDDGVSSLIKMSCSEEVFSPFE